MKKSELKTGMILTLRNGSKRIVLLGAEGGDTTCALAIYINERGGVMEKRLFDFFELTGWNENLTSNYFDREGGDIVKVQNKYGIIIWEELTKDIIDWDRLPLVEYYDRDGKLITTVQVTNFTGHEKVEGVVTKLSGLNYFVGFKSCTWNTIWEVGVIKAISYIIPEINLKK